MPGMLPSGLVSRPAAMGRPAAMLSGVPDMRLPVQKDK